MQSFIEALYKSGDRIDFGWKPEPGAYGYRMYVGLSSLGMTLLYTDISAQASESSKDRGKVSYPAMLSDVRAILGLTTQTFADTVFYFAITYQNSAGSWSSLGDSTIVEVPPVGITGKYMKDDPSINRHIYLFAPDIQKWVKATGTSTGGMVVDTADYYKSNITTEYTYVDGTNVATTKSYPSDATASGSPAKLTTYTWSGSQVIKVSVTDSTV
jgi:hypothetical protein